MIRAADHARPRLWPDSMLDRPAAAGLYEKIIIPRPHPSPESNCGLLPARRGLPPEPRSGGPAPEAAQFTPCFLRANSKRMPLMIRNARAAACQGAAPRKRSSPRPCHAIPAGWPSPYKALTNRLCRPYRRWFLLELYRFPLRARPEETRLAQRNAGTGVDPMREIEAGTLLLFPTALAVAFLLWVLWNLLKQDRQIASWIAARRRKSLASSQRTDRRSMPSRPAILHRG